MEKEIEGIEIPQSILDRLNRISTDIKGCLIEYFDIDNKIENLKRYKNGIGKKIAELQSDYNAIEESLGEDLIINLHEGKAYPTEWVLNKYKQAQEKKENNNGRD